MIFWNRCTLNQNERKKSRNNPALFRLVVPFNCIRTLSFYKLQLHPVNAAENIQKILNILHIPSFIFSQKVVEWF